VTPPPWQYPGQQNSAQPYPGQLYPGQPYPPAPLYYPEPKPEPLPVEPKDYLQFYRAPAFRWWKPLLALLLFAAIWIPVSILIVAVPIAWDVSQGVPFEELMGELNTPAFFLANNVLLAAAIPIAMLASRVVYRQRPGFLSSITGRFRWGLFGHFLLIAAPLMVVWMGVQLLLTGGFGELRWGPDSLLLLVGILLTTPLQAAGEEYGFRGLLARSVGSWFGNRWVALAVATVVNSVAFMFVHGAGEPWLNVFYLVVGILFTLLAWRTGGLEAAVVMHIVNNLFGELTLPFSPDEFSHLFDRQAGVAGPETLIQIGVVILTGALIWWRASRLGVARAAAPGAVPARPFPDSGFADVR
jgi:membrane protease YdiL (CAAX protease family)